MFSCESLGISDDQESTSDYDKANIREFEESIEYKDNSYHIKLPWHKRQNQFLCRPITK